MEFGRCININREIIFVDFRESAAYSTSPMRAMTCSSLKMWQSWYSAQVECNPCLHAQNEPSHCSCSLSQCVSMAVHSALEASHADFNDCSDCQTTGPGRSQSMVSLRWCTDGPSLLQQKLAHNLAWTLEAPSRSPGLHSGRTPHS